MFVKHGDGKIMNVLEDVALTEEQKKSIKDKSDQLAKQAETTIIDTSAEQKKSEN